MILNYFFNTKLIKGYPECPDCPPDPCQDACCFGGGGGGGPCPCCGGGGGGGPGGGGPFGPALGSEVNINEIENFLMTVGLDPFSEMNGGGGNEACPDCGCGGGDGGGGDEPPDIGIIPGFYPPEKNPDPNDYKVPFRDNEYRCGWKIAVVSF